MGMTHEFASLFAAHVVARISDPEEMQPAFDDDEEDVGGDGDDGDDGDGGGQWGRGYQGRRGDRGRDEGGRVERAVR